MGPVNVTSVELGEGDTEGKRKAVGTSYLQLKLPVQCLLCVSCAACPAGDPLSAADTS